ncbi:HBR189Wp [Eremothecium sinecaudum]|uniref:Phosphoribosylaminoimidazole-succinocarboxamide synthase n=1 Tax=Eremothecium sinecaudum TaxID=45286 RepID=A0A125RE08_9SACH|nr:HBR189Wp [Eremothecium sinecaudum]AMD19090.1 HBR189Wp [Eremothecium sinecaudum]
MTVVKTDLDGILPLVARGKVRDIYEVDDQTLLFVATDRISAYDVIMQNAIPDKGVLLTRLSEFWFDLLKDDVRNHLKHIEEGKTMYDYLPEKLKEEKYRKQLSGRSLLVQKHKLIPLEVIVRGYITGSAWKEYKKSGTVHGLPQPEGLQESQEFPEAIYTPSTKAEQGDHDENISPEQAAQLVGKELNDRVAALAIKLYTKCKEYAKSKGIIIADTKFEFGIDEETNEIILVDEVLTPDSSRFWAGSSYAVGHGQDSYDKQFLRDWLTSKGLNGVDGVEMPEEIVNKSRSKYIEAYEALTGKQWQ